MFLRFQDASGLPIRMILVTSSILTLMLMLGFGLEQSPAERQIEDVLQVCVFPRHLVQERLRYPCVQDFRS
jgi:hypothetical protein